MSWTLSTEAASIAKAGEGANATVVAVAATLAKWSDQAEGKVVAETRRDWVTDFAGLSTEIKAVLDDVISSMVAMQIIAYDMGGYTSRAEAQTMLDVQDDIAQKCIRFLKDFKSNDIQST